MYRKIVWYGTDLTTDIMEIFQLVLENENKSILEYVYNVIQKRRDI